MRSLTCHSPQLGEEARTGHTHFASEDIDVEIRIVQMTFDNSHRTVEHLLIHRVGSQHLGKSLWLFTELLLQ